MESKRNVISALSDASQLLGVVVGLVLAAAVVLGVVLVDVTEHLIILGLFLFVASSTVGFVVSVGLQRLVHVHGRQKSWTLIGTVALFAGLLYASQLLNVDSTAQTLAAMVGFIGLGATAGVCTLLACAKGVSMVRLGWGRLNVAP